MKHVVFFRELERSDSSATRTLKESVNHLDQATAEFVADYLDGGINVVDYLGDIPDPLDPRTVISGGRSLKTDGVWYWREDLAYFVRRYLVFVPPEFVEHAINNEPLDEPDEASLRRLIDEVYETHQQAYRKGLR